MLGTSWDIQSMCGGMRRDRFVVQKYGNTTGTPWDACIQQFVIRVTGSSEKAFCDITWNLFQLLAGTSSINGTNKVIWVYMQLLNH